MPDLVIFSSDADWLFEQLRRRVDALDTSVFDAGYNPGPGPFVAESSEVGLVESGARRELAERLRADAMRDCASWARVAVAAGVPVARVARLAGVTRPTVYSMLRGA